MKSLNPFLKLLILEGIFVFLVIISFTAIRFLDNDSFVILRDRYMQFALFDTSVSYVLEGLKS